MVVYHQALKEQQDHLVRLSQLFMGVVLVMEDGMLTQLYHVFINVSNKTEKNHSCSI